MYPIGSIKMYLLERDIDRSRMRSRAPNWIGNQGKSTNEGKSGPDHKQQCQGKVPIILNTQKQELIQSCFYELYCLYCLYYIYNIFIYFPTTDCSICPLECSCGQIERASTTY